MKHFLKFISIALAGAAVLASCNSSRGDDATLSTQDKEMKALVEQYVPGVIYEIYGNLADEAENLYAALRDAKAKAKAGTLTDADMQAVARTFYNSREWWEKSEAFLFGAASVYKIDPHIDAWPLDKKALAKALQNEATIDDLDEDEGGACGLVGADALGFHGIEYILFRDGKVRTASQILAGEDIAGYTIDGETELIFATAVADDLRGYCFELQAAWDPSDVEFDFSDDIKTRRAYVEDELELLTTMENGMTFGENLLATGTLGSTYRAWTVAVNSILVAGCSNICNEVANTKLGTAHNAQVADEDDTDADYNYIESPYSQRSFVDFKGNILSIQYSLYGKNGATAPEKNSISSFLSNNSYTGAKALDDALKAALAALDDCNTLPGGFVNNRNDAKVDVAIDAINALDDELNKAAAWVLAL